MKLRFTTSAEGVGEQEKTIKYRFFEAKELKQGVCQAEYTEATADDYATRVGLSNPTSAKVKRLKNLQNYGIISYISVRFEIKC